MPEIAGVIVNRTARNVDKPFSYLIPAHLAADITIGCVVRVPFGRNNAPVDGYVVSLSDAVPAQALKEIVAIVDPLPQFGARELRLCAFLRQTCFATWLEAIRAVTPPAKGLVSVSDKYVRVSSLAIPEEDAFDLLDRIRTKAPAQTRVIELLLQNDFVSNRDIAHLAGCGAGTLKALEAKGVIVSHEVEVFRTPAGIAQAAPTKPHPLTPAQAHAVSEIAAAMDRESPDTFLLHGVTGSGKTEVFLQAIRHAVDRGKTALVLVPEIALTPQMIERFAGRFGSRIAVLHSRLSLGERYDQWKRIRNGDVDVVVGVRSAVFAPLARLGIVILDEEHETTYKSEMSPRYHARDIAKWLCRETGAALVLASATPSIESYWHAERGDYHLLTLPDRINQAALPDVMLADMRAELQAGNRSVLSVRLQEEIQKNLDAGQQTILFMNRRGYATFVSCRSCGYVAKCENCNIPLTYHKYKNYLTCHYCGYTTRTPQTCPVCGSRYIRQFGSGTQKVEEEVRALFPAASVLRMDMDTTAHKASHEQILTTFREGKVDILIGTQMVAKGLDFPNVTLVGVLAADMSLNMDDFRAGERTFGLITQVCGRAGRAEKPGRAVVQTYDPDNEILHLARQQDYPGFYRAEIPLRRALCYPPFSDIVSLLFTGQNEGQVAAYARHMAQRFRAMAEKSMQARNCYALLGPCPCTLPRINNKYRYRMLIKCTLTDDLRAILSAMLSRHHTGKEKKWITLAIDVNPTTMN